MLHVISDGTWKLDGGSLFGEIPRVSWQNSVTLDRRHCVTLGLNCLLIDTLAGKVLVDTGVGSILRHNESFRDTCGLTPSRLPKGLKALGVRPKDINIVILSDLRFIHAGGAVREDRTGNVIPTFPRAKYIVQKDALREALGEFSKPPSKRSSWHPDPDTIISPLADRGQLLVIDGDCEILPGINVRKTTGFTMGHQVVRINEGSEHVAFLGSVVPTRMHLMSEACIPAGALHAEVAFKEKKEILREAIVGRWLVVLPWEAKTPAGYVQEVRGDSEGSGRTTRFVPVDLSATRQPALAR